MVPFLAFIGLANKYYLVKVNGSISVLFPCGLNICSFGNPNRSSTNWQRQRLLIVLNRSKSRLSNSIVGYECHYPLEINILTNQLDPFLMILKHLFHESIKLFISIVVSNISQGRSTWIWWALGTWMWVGNQEMFVSISYSIFRKSSLKHKWGMFNCNAFVVVVATVVTGMGLMVNTLSS